MPVGTDVACRNSNARLTAGLSPRIVVRTDEPIPSPAGKHPDAMVPGDPQTPHAPELTSQRVRR